MWKPRASVSEVPRERESPWNPYREANSWSSCTIHYLWSYEALVHLSTVISPTYIKLNLISAITKEDPGSVGRIPKGRAPVPVDSTTRRKQPRLTQLLFPWVFQSLAEIESFFFFLLIMIAQLQDPDYRDPIDIRLVINLFSFPRRRF